LDYKSIIFIFYLIIQQPPRYTLFPYTTLFRSTGIKFLDEIRLGSQTDLPSDLLNNKGRNHYYMLPFIIGLIGFIFHYRKDPKTFYVLLALFLFTSFALKIFLNERPFEPRE